MSKMKQRMAFVMSLAMAFTSVDTGLLVSAEDMTSTVVEESTVEVQDVEEENEGPHIEVADEDVETDIVTDGEVAEQALGEEGATVIEPQDTSDMIATFEAPNGTISGGGAGDTTVDPNAWIDSEKANWDNDEKCYKMNIAIKKNGSRTVKIPLTEKVPEDATYTWTENGNTISGNTSKCYINTYDWEEESKNITCTIKDAAGENSVMVEIMVSTWNIDYDYDVIEVSIPKDGSTTVNLKDYHNLPEAGLQYTWSEGGKDLETTGSSINVDAAGLDYANAEKRYNCKIADGDIEENVEVHVSLDTSNNIFIIGDEGDRYSHSYFTRVAVPGQKLELSVNAESEELAPDALQYQWYKYNYKTEKYEIIQGATSMTYSASSVTTDTMGEYLCVVTDGTSVAKAEFYVEVDSGFNLERTYQEIYIENDGTPVTLHTNATTVRGNLTYQWYKNDEKLAATSADYQVESAKENENYRCDISDGYNNASVRFHIIKGKSPVEANLNVDAPEKAVVEKGKEATVEVKATAVDGANIDYDWVYDAIDVVEKEKGKLKFIPDTDDLQWIYCTVSANGKGVKDDSVRIAILIGNKDKLNKVVSQALSFETARILKGSETLVAYKDNVKQYFKFVPDKDGAWRFSDYNYDFDEITLYNSAREKLCSTRDTESGVVYRLKANETYYVEVKMNAGTGRIGADYMDYNEVHQWLTPVISKAATCTTAGEKEIHCATCDMIYYETIPALGHSFNAFTVTKEASVLEEGSQYHTCSVCGTVETVAIPKLVSNVTLINSTLPLQVKQKASLSKNVKGLAKGDKIISCTLSAKDKKVVSVDKNGTVKGKKAGTATITMKFLSGATAKVKVKVQKKKVATSKITNVTKNITLKVKKSTKLAPFVTPITSKNKVTYKTSNKKIATVSSKGVIKAKKAGTATITVKSGSKTVKVKVKVTK